MTGSLMKDLTTDIIKQINKQIKTNKNEERRNNILWKR